MAEPTFKQESQRRDEEGALIRLINPDAYEEGSPLRFLLKLRESIGHEGVIDFLKTLTPEEKSSLGLTPSDTDCYRKLRDEIRSILDFDLSANEEPAADGIHGVNEKDKQQPNEFGQPEGQEAKWQEKIKEAPAFRTARPSDTTVSMEVKVLEPVRKASKELAAAHGMTAQQLMEQLLVDALNEDPKLLEQGRKRLEEFKGSTAKARRFAEREELARLRNLMNPSRQ